MEKPQHERDDRRVKIDSVTISSDVTAQHIEMHLNARLQCQTRKLPGCVGPLRRVGPSTATSLKTGLEL